MFDAKFVIWTCNCLPFIRFSSKTSLKIFYSKKPFVQYVHCFGYLAWYHIPKERHQKLNTKIKYIYIYIGYLDVAKRYEIFLPKEKKLSLS